MIRRAFNRPLASLPAQIAARRAARLALSLRPAPLSPEAESRRAAYLAALAAELKGGAHA